MEPSIKIQNFHLVSKGDLSLYFKITICVGGKYHHSVQCANSYHEEQAWDVQPQRSTRHEKKNFSINTKFILLA